MLLEINSRPLKAFLIIFFYFFSYKSFASSSYYGQTGYIFTPSAHNIEESSITLGFNRSFPDRSIHATISPFNNIDITVFYVDIANMPYGNGFKQSYKDKGFNFKYTLINSDEYALAIGGNDVAGTGLYSSEYIVATRKINNLELTIGLGWGNYKTKFQIDNPLIKISNTFGERSLNFKNKGGTPDFNNYFSGTNASILAGLKYALDNRTSIVFELDPTNTEGKVSYTKKKSNYNFGIQKNFSKFNFFLGQVRGEELYLSLSTKNNFSNYTNYKLRTNSDIVNNYKDLQKKLASNRIGLEKIYTNDKTIKVVTKQNSFHNQSMPNYIILDSTKDLSDDIEEVIISQKYAGMEMITTKYAPNRNISVIDESYEYENQINLDQVYEVIENYPIINNSMYPIFKTFIAAREKFLFQGLLLSNDLEINFKENISIKANFKYSLYDDFDGLFIPPVDTYPNQVRSDVKKYLNEVSNRVTIGRLEFNHFSSIGEEHFFRASAGIYEDMFGGMGIDYVYYPKGSAISYGSEVYFVKKRDYSQRFSFQDYSNILSRAFLNYYDPNSKINMNVSYGEYLAGDIGYTFEVGRRFKNGVEFSGFFSLTDVTTDQYGEGAFDKGIKVVIPLGLFGNGLQTYVWRPLTKDPAALLNKSINLHRSVQRFRVY